MPIHFPRFKFAALLALVFCFGVSGAERAGSITGELRAGRRVVVAVAPAAQQGQDANEAYGDWADRLNQFSQHLPNGVRVLKFTSSGLRKVVRQPVVSQQYATLFLKDRTHGLLYDGMILEAEVYRLGLAWLDGRSDENELAASGLRPVLVRLR